MFRRYLKQFKRYPFMIYDKDGNVVDLLLTEQEHEKFIKNMELIERIQSKIFELDILYSIEITLNYDEINGVEGLKMVLMELEELLSKQ